MPVATLTFGNLSIPLSVHCDKLSAISEDQGFVPAWLVPIAKGGAGNEPTMSACFELGTVDLPSSIVD